MPIEKPIETLMFFGFRDDMSVLELFPRRWLVYPHPCRGT